MCVRMPSGTLAHQWVGSKQLFTVHTCVKEALERPVQHETDVSCFFVQTTTERLVL